MNAMLATILVLMTLGQAADPLRFTWVIVGLGDPTRETLEVTVSPTPLESVNGVKVTSIGLAPLPTLEDGQPRAILPRTTEPTPKAGLRAWFTPPGRRFHLVVTLSDGSTHTIDIYRPVPPAEEPTPRMSVPTRLMAPRGIWTTDRFSSGGVSLFRVSARSARRRDDFLHCIPQLGYILAWAQRASQIHQLSRTTLDVPSSAGVTVS